MFILKRWRYRIITRKMYAETRTRNGERFRRGATIARKTLRSNVSALRSGGRFMLLHVYRLETLKLF